jgi:predicted MFS family arabinose efflux permease
VGYLIYFASVSLLRTPEDYPQAAPSKQSIFGDIIDGARYVLAHRGIGALLLLMLLGDALSTAVYQMLPAISVNMLGGGVGGMSSLLSAAGLGATLSALWLAHGGAKRVDPRIVLWAFLAFVFAVAALMFARHLVAGIVMMLAFGFAGEARRTGTVSILQTSVDDAQRGRVMSTQFMLQRMAGGIGAIVVGAAADTRGPQLPMLIIVAAALVAWAVAFINRRRILGAFVAS